jgi:hypothetical protein
MGEIRNAYTYFWSEDLEGKDQLGEVGVDGRIIWIHLKETGFNVAG